MSTLTLLLGGARSGKSSYALKLAKESGNPVTFIATAQAFDDEMSARIQKHKTERPAHWQTLELPLNIASNVSQIKSDAVILDCVTLLATNLMMQFVKDDLVDELPYLNAIQNEMEALLSAIRNSNQHWIVVSNEVGLGLVPPYQMGRIYRDGLGWANQRLAKEADTVLFMVAGLPMTIKS
ncbi:bifunctional adenosylcobinamide kinase/adenosylcobinamide-phosphate guanylyltransferase [Candidatus Villigracilis affinis]|uniref:bifunctional adenosylcobinamide kinase/adenosylcobinamide-phosphate guanylyltransferase n=1 Tax=Candidatus Villigracilis affinis TaxID=3140682 RepID=UPI002A1F24F5|nr:bifunctional adenosylcobinamide kinase/adenosylcobinamide-phosphate guanylyltransferase [Anaerolineales bacterium]